MKPSYKIELKEIPGILNVVPTVAPVPVLNNPMYDDSLGDLK